MLAAKAVELGIKAEHQLYGGVVPHRHVGTKAISHSLVSPDAAAPVAWHHRLGSMLEAIVPTGFTAFDAIDAFLAGKQLLSLGPIRIKKVQGTSGRGQSVVRSINELEAVLTSLDAIEIATHGLVIEENLTATTTYSVGTTSLMGEQIAYWGTQRLTTSNHGGEVYGGSDLCVVRGPLEALLALKLAAGPRRAVEQALRYDGAVFQAYPGLFASRRNYDVIEGLDPSGDCRSGVLEQSWRIGGASGAEIAAFEAFRKNPELAEVHSSTMEIFGESEPPPAHATVYYRSIDPIVGPVTKYAMVKW